MVGLALLSAFVTFFAIEWRNLNTPADLELVNAECELAVVNLTSGEGATAEWIASNTAPRRVDRLQHRATDAGARRNDDLLAARHRNLSRPRELRRR